MRIRSAAVGRIATRTLLAARLVLASRAIARDLPTATPAEEGIGPLRGRGNGNPMPVRMTDRQAVEALGTVPLKFQPGSDWVYGRSTDVLLALVEVVSGQRGDVFMQQRIFGPLGMTETVFNVPLDKRDRVAQSGPDPDTAATADLTDVTRTRTFLGGGEGLLSTASDYMRFARMLANGGEGNGVRLLSQRRSR